MKIFSWFKGLGFVAKLAANWQVYALGASLLVTAAGGAYLWHGWEVDGAHDEAFAAGRKEAEYEHQTALLEGLREGTRQTSHLQGVKDAAITEAEKRAKDNARAAAGARTELDRLRKQAATGAGDAGTTHAACTEYATAATDVLGECASALVSLAATADGHVNDIRTLTGAWPQWDKVATLSPPTAPTAPSRPSKP